MISLVGAGPGDPELLTLKAARLLQQADVVLVDRLVDPRILEHCRAGVEVVDVGKTSWTGTAPRQEEINAQLVAHAQAGKRAGAPVPQELINALLVQLGRDGREVVRLKGGDPFVFGRGGEEALALAAAGIAFEVVPGVSSVVAAPAAAGIPVTQRGVSASFTVVTGHRQHGESPVNWAALAQAGGTIVVLMGVAQRGLIAAELIEGGLPVDTPVAAIRHATGAEQDVVRCTLGTLGETGVRSPATLVVGAVAGFDVFAGTAVNDAASGARRRS
ncbi:MAG: uroporphyrinogen-III C-methyltransferase [Ilumatobacteraceae bacterium]